LIALPWMPPGGGELQPRTVSLGSLWRSIAVTFGLADLRVCWGADRERP
jgi:hypothetical protein